MPAALCLACRHLFNKPRLRNVMEDAEHPDLRLLLLEEGLTEAGAPGGSRRGGAGCAASMHAGAHTLHVHKHMCACGTHPAIHLFRPFNMRACLQTWASDRSRESLPGAWRSWCRQRA